MSRPISAYSQNVKFGPVFPDFDEGEGSHFHTIYIQHLCSQVVILTRKAPERYRNFPITSLNATRLGSHLLDCPKKSKFYLAYSDFFWAPGWYQSRLLTPSSVQCS